jgi:hypothetical protein
LSILCSAEDPMMDRVNFFSEPSSIVKMALTVARFATCSFVGNDDAERINFGEPLWLSGKVME